MQSFAYMRERNSHVFRNLLSYTLYQVPYTQLWFTFQKTHSNRQKSTFGWRPSAFGIVLSTISKYINLKFLFRCSCYVYITIHKEDIAQSRFRCHKIYEHFRQKTMITRTFFKLCEMWSKFVPFRSFQPSMCLSSVTL